MIFCLTYLETLSGDRELGYAADLVRRIEGAQLIVYLRMNRQVAALVAGPLQVHDVLSKRYLEVTRRVTRITGLPFERLQFGTFAGEQPSWPQGAIAVGNSYAERRPPAGVHALIPAAESSIDQRGGPFVIPFGNRGSGLLASRAGIRLAKALGKEVVFYHTTWKSETVNSDDPRDNMCPAAVEIMKQLEAAAQTLGVPQQTVIEMAPDVTLGIRDCAGAHYSSLLVCAYGRWKGGRGGGSGSHVTKLLQQSAYAMLIVQEVSNHE